MKITPELIEKLAIQYEVHKVEEPKDLIGFVEAIVANVEKDMVTVIGKRADGSSQVLGMAPMSARMKAREIVLEMIGPIDEDGGNDAALAYWCCEQLIEWMEKS